MAKTIKNLIICQRCGNEHGPCEAKHVVRFTCGHCGKSCDTADYTTPESWATIMKDNVFRYSLCPDCTVLQQEWLSKTE